MKFERGQEAVIYGSEASANHAHLGGPHEYETGLVVSIMQCFQPAGDDSEPYYLCRNVEDMEDEGRWYIAESDLKPKDAEGMVATLHKMLTTPQGEVAAPVIEAVQVAVPTDEFTAAVLADQDIVEGEVVEGELVIETAEVDMVNHPPHYTSHPSGVEVIQITEWLNFCIGNAVKYLLRADLKGNTMQDLEKARWYVDREIDRRQRAELLGIQ